MTVLATIYLNLDLHAAIVACAVTEAIALAYLVWARRPAKRPTVTEARQDVATDWQEAA